MDWIQDIIYPLIGGFMGLGLLFIIINGAIRNLHYRTKALLNLFVGLILSGIFIAALIYDYTGGLWTDYLSYWIYIGVSLVYAISLGFRAFRFRKPRNRSSVHSYREYLFLLYRCGTEIYLENKKDQYQGIIVRMKDNNFQDEMIKSLNERFLVNRFGSTEADVTCLGKVTIHKKREIYHCYIAELKKETAIEGLEKINAYQVQNLLMDELNRQIVYRMILRDPFTIEL
jgi:hypothetical protein